MRTALTTLLVVALLALLAIWSWLMVLFLEWPLWGAFAIFFGAIGTFFGLKALRSFILRTRMKSRLLSSENKNAQLASQKIDYKQ